MRTLTVEQRIDRLIKTGEYVNVHTTPYEGLYLAERVTNSFEFNKENQPYHIYKILSTGIHKYTLSVMSNDNSGQYLRFSSSLLDNAVTMTVHRLVAETFNAHSFEENQVHHVDGNTFNNHKNNLEWLTPGEHNKITFSNSSHAKMSTYGYAHNLIKDGVFYLRVSNKNELGLTVSDLEHLRNGRKSAKGYKLLDYYTYYKGYYHELVDVSTGERLIRVTQENTLGLTPSNFYDLRKGKRVKGYMCLNHYHSKRNLSIGGF